MIKVTSSFGATLIETILAMVIIGIIAGTGSMVIGQSMSSYYTQKNYATAQSQFSISLNKLSNYITPYFKNMYKPLYLSSPVGDSIIIAHATTAFDQSLDPNNIYISQLVKIELVGTDVILSNYIPVNLASDTSYPYPIPTPFVDFNQLTNSLTPSNTITLATNINSIDFSYYDINQLNTLIENDIATVNVDINITKNTITRERSIMIYPWRLLWHSMF